MAEVGWKGGSFVVRVEFWDNERAKSLPKRVWSKDDKYWVAPPTKPNAMYLRKEFHISEITENAMREIERIDVRLPEIPFPPDYDFGEFPAMPHQIRGLNDAWGHNEHAFFFDMRLGKTFTAIHLANARYQHGQIERLLVICPTPIKDVWGGPEGELRKFLDPDELDMFTMESGQNKQAERWMRGHANDLLQIMVVGVEALSQGGAYSVARQFCIGGVPTMIVLDESSRIKTWNSKRTEKCCILANLCDYKLILTGTPVTQGMHDLFSQMEFLSSDIIGQKSFYTFRNRYMVMGGFEGRQILGYRNANELLQLVEPYATVVKKEEVYDLPTQPPQIRMIQPTTEQKKHFLELKHLMRTTYGDDELEAKTMLERMTRFQQINGGFFPHPIDKDNKGKTIWGSTPLKSNPKINELENMLDEFGDLSVIIWARFVPEIEAIIDMLAKHNRTAVSFYGATSPEGRIENKRQFQAGEAQFFVGNQTVGGMGVKLSNADVMVYYSNTFSWDDKTQSWSRAEDMEMTEAILYIEMVLNTVIDKSIMAAQTKKGGMAAYVDENLAALKREM
jgi:SNF2 family DNA or RNA helicase